jgi:hypothetical protein
MLAPAVGGWEDNIFAHESISYELLDGRGSSEMMKRKRYLNKRRRKRK